MSDLTTYRCRAQLHEGQMRLRITLPAAATPKRRPRETLIWLDDVEKATAAVAKGEYDPKAGSLVGIPTAPGQSPAIYLLRGGSGTFDLPEPALLAAARAGPVALPVHLLPAAIAALDAPMLARVERQQGGRVNGTLRGTEGDTPALTQWFIAEAASLVGIPTKLAWHPAKRSKDASQCPCQVPPPTPAQRTLRISRAERREWEADGFHFEEINRYSEQARDPKTRLAFTPETGKLFILHEPGSPLLKARQRLEQEGRAIREAARQRRERTAPALAMLAALKRLKPSEVDPTLVHSTKRMARFLADLRALQHDLDNGVEDRNIFWYYRHPVLGAIYDTAFPFPGHEMAAA